MDGAGSTVVAHTEGKTRCFGKGVWCPDERFYGVTLQANTHYHLGFLNRPTGDMSGPSCYRDQTSRTVDTTVYRATFDDPRSTSSATSPVVPGSNPTGESCRWKLNCGGPGAVMPYSGLMNGGSNIWSSLGNGGTATTRVILTQTCINPLIAYYQHKDADETISGSYFIMDSSGTSKLASTPGRTLCFCKDCWCPADRFLGVTLDAGTHYHLGFYNSPSGDMSGPACYNDQSARTVGIATFDQPRSANGVGYAVPSSNSAGGSRQCRWMIDCQGEGQGMGFPTLGAHG